MKIHGLFLTILAGMVLAVNAGIVGAVLGYVSGVAAMCVWVMVKDA